LQHRTFARQVGTSFDGWVSGGDLRRHRLLRRGVRGLRWNALNITIVVALLIRARQRLALA
jgi:hypothetical protein